MPGRVSNSVRQELLNQHARLEETLRILSNATSAQDPRPLQEAWAEFETGLLRHLELEEGTIIPLFAATHPAEAHALLSDHDRIRDVVLELGLCCDLHAVRKSAVERLIRMLRAHAEREDATLYRWLDDGTDMDTRRHLLRLLVNTVRSEVRSGAGTPDGASRSV